MQSNIRFKRGNFSNLPTSAPSGTPLWCNDTHELYIGTGNSVAKVASSSSSGGGSSSSATVSYDSITKTLIFGNSSYESDSYTKDEIDNMFGDIESLLQEI